MVRAFDRREFLKWTGTGVASQFLLSCVDGASPSSSGRKTGSPGVGDTLDGGVTVAPPPGLVVPDLLNRTPRSVLRGTDDELDLDLAILDGVLPADMHGHYFMVCAVPKQDGNFIINGDGMIHRLDFGDATVRLRTRLAKTPCYYAEKAVAGTDDAFESKGAARLSKALGVRNQANTALVPMGTDRMLVTFDAGRPFEIDPVSLELKTPVGYNSEWQKALDLPDFMARMVLGTTFPLVQSTAHPCYDPYTQEVYSLNYGGGLIEILGQPVGGAPFTHIMRWDGVGNLRHYKLKLSDGSAVAIEQSGHQMHVTERYIVVMDCSFLVETDFMFNPDSFQTQKSETVLYVVRRDDVNAAANGAEVVAQRFTIPREAPHFLVDYENPDGRLVVHLVHNNAYDASEWMRASDVRYDSGASIESDLRGMLATTTDNNFVGRYVIDVDGGALINNETQLLQHDDFTWGVTLYTHEGMWMPERHEDLWWISAGFAPDTLPERVGDAYAGYPHRSVPIANLPFADGKPCALFRSNVRSAQIADGYQFPRGRFASSPQLVPRYNPRSATDGYIVCTVISDDTSTASSSGDEFWIFDAANLQQGPICRLGHARLNLPFTLHTTWTPTIEARSASYKVDVRQDYAEQVAKLSPTLQAMFERDVYPRFG